MNFNGQNPLGNMQNLKSSLPSNGDLNGESRPGYSTPMMVLPSGQTLPLSSIYGQQHGTADASAQMPYMPNTMFPGFMGNGMPATGLSNYAWPYALTPSTAGMDTGRRTSWSSNEENMAAQPVVNNAAPQDYYNPMACMPMTASQSQHYIAGPIQPMKCNDNKSYEMANLDELVAREPAMPRAVPALWTNQEELSLAKCLQNPEGITNVYIRGFMPDTTDEDLEGWAARFGEIESCKAIIEQDTGKCKGQVTPNFNM